ncbi:MAG TPA: CHASE2 domain-containing protein [Blastocatellia bacterium]|nr:CHASE2 domain-containing protein [Blastocatellia bacterium]
MTIVAISSVLALIISWRVPELDLYARDWLMRTRGALVVPEDIVIVAIDEASLKALGRFPWRRRLMAEALDYLTNAQPKAIALDVLYVDPTDQDEDSALAAAIERADKVIVAAQLTSVAGTTAEEERTVWLRPLPAIEKAAAAVGHVNVYTGFDSVARLMLLRQTDDEARPLWAMAVETVRVGEGVRPDALRELPEQVLIGVRPLPLTVDSSNLMIESEGAGMQALRAARMMIDYVGPTGSFASQTVSFVDLVEKRVDPERLRGKYVLVGATAATLGERVAAPLIHTARNNRPRSELMPGVEVLANQVNTILRGRFYYETPLWLTLAGLSAVVAAVILLAALTQGNYEAARQIAALAGLLALILIVSYLAFAKFLLLPPLIPMLVAFMTATPLALLQRSIMLNSEIEARIEELSRAGQALFPSADNRPVTELPYPGPGHGSVSPARRWRWSRGAAWKARELKRLNQQLAERVLFVDRALRSIEDGLMITATDARIVFANPRAAAMLDRPERGFIGQNLFECLSEASSSSQLQTSTLISRLQYAEEARTALQQLLDSRRPLERELTLERSMGQRHYALCISTVSDSPEGAVFGLIAVLTDITRHRELQRTQRDVMALVTHELKTPLTAIQGMSEVLAQFDVDLARRREMHLTINDEAKRLTRMIDEYLDLARLEAGTRQLRLAPMRLEQLLDRTLLLLAPVAERRGITIIRDYNSELPPLLGDADLIARAVMNLTDNAIKFSPPNSRVTVSARADETNMSIEVADEGQGIAPEYLPRIFEKFYRVPRLADVDVPGTGLGLSLVREVTELHGGRITVESQPGTGSWFSMRLPLQTDNGDKR